MCAGEPGASPTQMRYHSSTQERRMDHACTFHNGSCACVLHILMVQIHGRKHTQQWLASMAKHRYSSRHHKTAAKQHMEKPVQTSACLALKPAAQPAHHPLHKWLLLLLLLQQQHGMLLLLQPGVTESSCCYTHCLSAACKVAAAAATTAPVWHLTAAATAMVVRLLLLALPLILLLLPLATHVGASHAAQAV